MIFPTHKNSYLLNPHLNQQISQMNSFKEENKKYDQQKCQSEQKKKLDNLKWIKSKYAQFDELNQVSPVYTPTNHNYKSIQMTKYFIKSEIINNRKNVQQNPEKKIKRFHSQSIYQQQKKRKSEYSKFFNQTMVDNEHNFIGKSYLRQVKNCKLNSQKNIQEFEENKIFISTKIDINKKGYKSKQFINQKVYQNSGIFKCRNTYNKKLQKYNDRSLDQLNMKKKLSLNQDLLTRKYSPGVVHISRDQLINNDKTSTSLNLIKQIQKIVKNDIKLQINKDRKQRINKYKYKKIQQSKKLQIIHKRQNNSKKNIRDSIQYQSQFNSPQKNNPQKNRSDMSQFKDTTFNFVNKSKIQQKFKKSSSSFCNYQNYHQFTNYNTFKHNIEDIQELMPWESDTTDYFPGLT